MPRTPMGLTVAFLVTSILHAVARAQQGPSPPPSPPPGQLVDVGGWRLHINCTGEGRPAQPTVILESGLGDFSVEWSLVQPRVAQFARVCSYDRAGDGWSELGPHPRTLHQIVYELHVLLDRANLRPPYVLAGHSYGGWLVRLYAYAYPAEVAGLVLIDAGADDPLRLMADGTTKRSSELTTSQAVPAVRTSGPLRESDVPSVALAQMKAAAEQSARDANPDERRKLPQDAQDMRTWTLARWQHLAAAVNPVESEELAAFRAEQARTEHPLGDRPLIVLTRGMPDETGPNAATLEAQHKTDQAKMARLSTQGRQIIAEHSGHHIQLDEPELATQAIGAVLGRN